MTIKYKVLSKGRVGYRVVKLKFESGCYDYLVGKTTAKLKDTGNGYIAKFNSTSSTQQDRYVCLDYSDAYELYLMLKEVVNDLGD